MRAEPDRPTFTDLLRRLEAEAEHADDETFLALWRALRAALVSELRKRNLWESPPEYLGVYGAASWEGEPRGGDFPEGRSLGPLDELVSDCYTYVFVDRLRALHAQLGVKENVDGLVFLNVRHFLYERQKEHDPLGFQIFEVVRKAVRRAVEAGEVAVLEGDPRVRNETVLGFGTEPGGETPGAESEGVDMEDLARRWNDDLLPDLVTAHGRGRQPVLGSLQERLKELRRRGVEAIRFKDLVDPLKQDVRARWADLLEREVAEVETDEAARRLNAMAHLFQPGARFEQRQSYRALVGCISDLLAGYEGGEATRRHLETLWGFLRTWSSGGPDSLPSQRRLATLLDIPRDRLPELYRLLRGFASECAGLLAGLAAERAKGKQGGSPPGAPPGAGGRRG